MGIFQIPGIVWWCQCQRYLMLPVGLDVWRPEAKHRRAAGLGLGWAEALSQCLLSSACKNGNTDGVRLCAGLRSV